MPKATLNVQLQISFIKEGNTFVAYSPALDLSTSGKTLKKAKKRFEEASQLFFEEIISKGTIQEVLNDLGWQKVRKEWKPPMIISQQSETISIPC